LDLFLIAPKSLGADSLISPGATWKYLDNGVDPGTAWRGAGFADASWASGPGQLGFGDGDEATVLRSGIITAYFRKRISVGGPASSLTLRVLRDDGVAVYLNGVEVYRNNLPPGSLSYNTLALAAIGGAEETTVFLTATINPSLLVAGENIIAAEVHQVNATSSDLSFDFELLADPGPPLPDLPVVALQTVDNTAAEGTSDRGRFRLVRSGPTTDPLNVTVNYGGTAMNGEDYAVLPTTVQIPSGSLIADLELVPIDDSLIEGSETFTVALVEPPCAHEPSPGPGCYFVGAPFQASATIVDNDMEPPPPPPPPGGNILIASNSFWNYLDDGSDQGTAWRAPDFDDSSWASGPGQLGYGDGDEATVVSFGPDPANKFITTYFRRAFDVGDASAVSNLVLHVLRDDGVVVYLNGVEVYRNNLPPGPISFTTLASSVVADENAYVAASISIAPLVSGRNVIAAEVHQVNGTSSDLGFDLALLTNAGSPLPPELPLVGVEAVENTAAESGADSGLFRVSRTGPTTDSLFVALAYTGTAVNGSDCLLLPLNVEIPPGSSSVNLKVEAVEDATVEGTESLVLVLEEPPCAIQDPSAPGCYRVAAPGQALVSILDNDFEPPPPPPGDITLIAGNSIWKYLDDGTDPGTAWRESGFDDSSWASGPGQLGYGDGDEATLISFGSDPANKFITTYFRRELGVIDVSTVSNLVLKVLRDDGVAVYLNGVEVFRNNLPAGALAFNTLATIAAPDENAYVTTPIDSTALVSGRNVLAAEVHQVNPLSSDLGFDLALFAEGSVGPPPNPCAPQPSPDDQTYPAVASDGTNFFVVWIDMRNRDSSWFDVYGSRVSATGEVLDPGGIPICTRASSAYYPSVAFDGANYFVVWSDDRDQSNGDPRLEIYGARVSPGGVVLDPDGILITHGEVAGQPTLAFNGTEHLVCAYTWEHNGHRGTTLLGVRVTPAGEVRDSEELILHQSDGGDYPAIVASAGGEWLVAWNGAGVEGARVSADGVVSSPRQLVDRGEAWVHGLAAVGGKYFLTTVADRPLAPDTHVMDVFGTWITHEGEPLNTVVIAANTNTTIGSFLQPTTYVQNHATAVANGPNVQVVWEAGAMYTNGGLFMFRSDIRSARVDANGNVFAVASVCAKPQDQSFAGLAFNGEQFLAVWQDARTAPQDEYSPLRAFDIYGTRITAAGEMTEADGFIISAVFPECDGDGDGVPDARDTCPDTPPGAIVNGDGCAIAQLSPCAGPWQHHADYIDSVITYAWKFYRDGIITAQQRAGIIHDAAQSDCGRSPQAREAARVHLLPITLEECLSGGLRVVVSRDPIGSCTIETSTDLVHWTLLHTLDAADIGSEIGCPHAVGEPSRFFRVRLQSP